METLQLLFSPILYFVLCRLVYVFVGGCGFSSLFSPLLLLHFPRSRSLCCVCTICDRSGVRYFSIFFGETIFEAVQFRRQPSGRFEIRTHTGYNKETKGNRPTRGALPSLVLRFIVRSTSNIRISLRSLLVDYVRSVYVSIFDTE